MRHAALTAMSLTFFVGAIAPPGYAQLQKTWVSGRGNDMNPCTQTQPCRTFRIAYSKTAAGGEINALDPADYLHLTISKAITIDGHGFGAITDAASQAIFVDAGDDDEVVLRNLQLSGAGIGFDGVSLNNARQLVIENCRISGFTGAGIRVEPNKTGGADNLVISNSTISMNIIPNSTPAGIFVKFGVTTVSHSLIAGNGAGIAALGTGVINADSNVITGNIFGVLASNIGGSGTVRLSNNDVYGNLTGFGCGGGVLASNGTNRKGNNVGGGTPTCAPTATITQQ